MRRPIVYSISLMLATLAGASQAPAADGDLPGASDYPGIERFTGSIITGYDARDFDATRLQTAPFQNGNATGDKRPEGRVTRIAYRTRPGPSIPEVAQSFETELAEAGYETVFTCNAEDCGGTFFSQAVDALFVPQMWVNGVNYRYVVGRKEGDDGAETWATVLVSHHADFVTAQLVVTEVGAATGQ